LQIYDLPPKFSFDIVHDGAPTSGSRNLFFASTDGGNTGAPQKSQAKWQHSGRLHAILLAIWRTVQRTGKARQEAARPARPVDNSFATKASAINLRPLQEKASKRSEN